MAEVAETSPADERRPTADPTRRVSPLARLTALEGLVLLGATLLTVGWTPILLVRTTPRMAVLWLLAPVGLVLLMRQVRGRDTAAMWLVGFLTSATLSAVLSPGVLHSFKGEFTSSTTVLVFVAVAGWWALGRHLGPDAREWLPWALLIGFGLNLAVGIVQVAFEITEGSLATVPGRASGFLDNPVYFGSFAAGATCWLVGSAAATRRNIYVGLATVGAFGAGLSGSRVAMAAVLVVACVLGAVYRHRVALLSALGVIGGLAGAWFFTTAVAADDTADRVTGTSGTSDRVGIWEYGFQAVADRPFFGWGFNHFATATRGRFTAEFVRRTGYDDHVQPWVHPHNIVVLLLVSVGIVGLALAVGFLVAALRGSVDVALLAACAGIAVTWLLQPATVHTLPIFMLLLGAAVRARRSDDTAVAPSEAERRSGWARAAAGAVAIGVVIAGYLMVGDYRLARARDSGDVDALESAGHWFVRDQFVTEFVSDQMELWAYAELPTAGLAVEWGERSVDILPSDPRLWTRLARRQFLATDLPAMKVSIDRALELQRWNPEAHRLLVGYAVTAGDDELLERAIDEACLLGLDTCDSLED